MNANGDNVTRIQAVFLRVLNIEVASPDQDVIDAGLLDSLGLIELLVALEQEFGVQLDLEELDLDDFRTVERIGAMIEAAPAS
jgi:acyl carrier protein